MQLYGKIALITGATTGIGRSAAEKFINEGVKALIITGQDEDRLAAAREELSSHNIPVTAIRWRANHPEDSTVLAEAVKAQYGKIDVIFANAGVTWPAPLGAIDAQAAQDQLMVNFTGPLILIQALTPLIDKGGSIVLNTSCLDVLGMPGMAVYAASKAALRSLARTLSVELADQGIRVNTVAPGPVDTPIYGKLGMTEDQINDMAQGILGKVPAGRFGSADEIAGAVAFLASDASSYMQGVEIPVDGGWSNL